MNSQYMIKLTPTTYKSLQQLAEDRQATINEVLIKLIKQEQNAVDLATGLDTVPSILVNGVDLSAQG